jgi:hypothetical protein
MQSEATTAQTGGSRINQICSNLPLISAALTRRNRFPRLPLHALPALLSLEPMRIMFLGYRLPGHSALSASLRRIEPCHNAGSERLARKSLG